MSRQLIEELNACINYLEVGRWLKSNGFRARPRYADREQFYLTIARAIEPEKILYLEFGVWRGASMDSWCKRLKTRSPRCTAWIALRGFPKPGTPAESQGTFSVNSVMPKFDDPRVVLHKGWFNETLPEFTLPEHDRLVLNLDADLYSSTIFVLETLESAIRPGTILIFDEFCDRLHELKAFREFLASTRMRFEFLGATENLEQVAFQRRT